MTEQLAFVSPSKGVLSHDEVIAEVIDYIKDHHQAGYSLIIGTDCKGHKGKIDFITAVVLHRRGLGGRYFWHKTIGLDVYSLRDKIYKETMLSLKLAEILVPPIREQLSPEEYNYNLEIHIDVGDTGQSRETVKEVVGMVTGSGYVVKTKPEAYGAFVIADKHTYKTPYQKPSHHV